MSNPGSDPPAAPPSDVVFVGPAKEAGAAPVLRFREGRVEAGELRAAQEGKPIVGELLRLQKRTEDERLFDVEVLAKGAMAEPPAAEPSSHGHKGPARVTTDAYRDGWESIFGARRTDLPS